MNAKVPEPQARGALPALRFDSLRHIDGLSHAVTIRHGGTSTRPCDSLNLGFHVGDDERAVQHNRKIVARHLGFEASHLVAMQQTHSAHVQIVTNENRGCGALDGSSAIPDTDALVVDETNLPLLVMVADCAPLLMVDAKHRVLAVVHAGWRGAVARIASKTLHRMTKCFGTRPEELHVGIGPCLCAPCFEVGDEVLRAANEIEPGAIVHANFGSLQARNASSNQVNKPHLDLRELLRADLRQHRVLDIHIEAMPHCPRCEAETFFSHRGENGTTGRFGLYAWWNR